MESMKIYTFYVETLWIKKNVWSRVIWDRATYRFVLLRGPSMEGKTMIIPQTQSELACYERVKGKKVFFFSADWCGDCRYIQPFFLPEIKVENSATLTILVDWDQYLDLQVWDI